MTRLNKRREQRAQSRVDRVASIRWPPLLRSVVLGGAAAFLVMGALIPSEAAISDGAYAPMAAGWCLLAVVWATSLWLDDQPNVRLGWTEVFGALLVAWH